VLVGTLAHADDLESNLPRSGLTRPRTLLGRNEARSIAVNAAMAPHTPQALSRRFAKENPHLNAVSNQ
jgi:hypothetical protein